LVAEIWMVLYLLVVGVKTVKADKADISQDNETQP